MTTVCRWDHVTMEYEGRTLLGDVRWIDGDRLAVYHFNGEPWPVQPSASEVCVISNTPPTEPRR